MLSALFTVIHLEGDARVRGDQNQAISIHPTCKPLETPSHMLVAASYCRDGKMDGAILEAALLEVTEGCG